MIGDNIRLRRKMRLSQEALAKGNWTRSYVSQIERGRILPSLQTLSQIANKLDTTVAELVGDQTTLAKAKRRFSNRMSANNIWHSCRKHLRLYF